jgi:hypothetical protein
MKRQLQLSENLPFCYFERREKSFLAGILVFWNRISQQNGIVILGNPGSSPGSPTPESRIFESLWMPVFTGMTTNHGKISCHF